MLFSCVKQEMTSPLKQLSPTDYPNAIVQKKGKTARLNFTTKEALNSLLIKMDHNPNSLMLLKNEIAKNGTIKRSVNNQDFYSAYEYGQDLVNEGYSNVWEEESTIQTTDDTYDLLPNIEIAQVLNANFELQIDTVIYKVTEYGTFAINQSKYNQAINFIDNLDNQNIQLSSSTRTLPGETPMETEDYYMLEPGIIRFDTYEDFDNTSTNSISPQNSTSSLEPGRIQLRSDVSTGNVIYMNYSNSKTYFNFNSDRRMRSNFNDYKFMFANFLSLELTFQKKGFLGIWSKETAQQLAIDASYLRIVRRESSLDDEEFEVWKRGMVVNTFYRMDNKTEVSVDYQGSTIRRLSDNYGNIYVEYIFRNENFEAYNVTEIKRTFLKMTTNDANPTPPNPVFTVNPSFELSVGTYAKYNNTWKAIYYHDKKPN